MSTPQRIGREKRASSAIVGDCVLHDGTCFRHERDRPLTKPRKQSLRDRDPIIAAQLDGCEPRVCGPNSREKTSGPANLDRPTVIRQSPHGPRGAVVSRRSSVVPADLDEGEAAGLDEPADHAFVDAEHRGSSLDRQERLDW